VQLEFDPNNPKYEYIRSKSHAEEALKKLSKSRVVGVDVETTGFDQYTETLLTVQIGNEEISYIFDARRVNLSELPLYKEILGTKKIIKLLHNAKFDYQWIKYVTGVELENIYDTMLAEAVLFTGLGSGFYSLASLAKKYINVDLDKDIRVSFEGMSHAKFNKAQLGYSAKDTLVLFPIFKKQLVDLKKKSVLNIAKLEFAVSGVVGEMEHRGIYMNAEKWKKLLGEIAVNRVQAVEDFYDAIRPLYPVSQMDLFGNPSPPINLNSQLQLMDLFNNKLKLSLPSTGVAILQEERHPIAKLLMTYRQYEKLLSAFGESFLKLVNKKTGRIHPSFNQMGTATGRFSCNNPNLQQVPSGRKAPFRECFNPKVGYKMVVSDYSSMEMRILADLSGDKKLIGAIESGLDLHSYTASLMFGMEYTDDFKEKHPLKRYAAKAINFGLMYGMGAPSLARKIDVTTEEGEEYMKRYFQSYPSVKDWLNNQASDAVKRGWSTTPMGRKRWYKMPERTDPDYRRIISKIQRQAKNHPIQGANADAIKYALVFVHERFKSGEFDGGITHTVHDEIVCEVREDQAENFAKVLSEEMVRAANMFIKKVPMQSNPFIGDVWEH